jgi:O-antigen/teichoic acid export membrane protein
MVDKARAHLSLSKLIALYRDPLYRNSIFIIMGSITASCLGLIFWVVAAQFYPIDDIGLASTLISACSLMSTVASMGLDQAMIKYMPTRDKSMVLGTALKANLVFSLVLGIAFVIGSSIWMPDMTAYPAFGLLFILLTCAMSASGITNTVFIGSRLSNYVLVMTFILGSRVLLLVPLVSLNSPGILLSLVIAYGIMFVATAFFMFRLKVNLGRFNWTYFKESFWFSTGNYIGTILYSLPTLVSPMIVYGLIGSDTAAIYYMSLSITAIVFYVPSSFSTSLFVEGSHGEGLSRMFRKALSTIYVLLVPLVILILLMGSWILGILGEEYAAQGPGLLNLLVISSLLLAPYLVESTALKVRGKVRGVIALSAVNAISFFTLIFVFISLYGPEGIGLAWIGSFAISALVGFFLVRDALR